MNIYFDKSNKDFRIITYYSLLTLVTIIMMRPGVEYSILIRFTYYAFVFVPLIFDKTFTPFAITTFYWVSFCSFTGLLPFQIIYSVVGLFFLWIGSKYSVRLPKLLILSFLYFFTLNIYFFEFEKTDVLWMGVLMALMLSSFIHSELDLRKFAFAFVVVSFVMSIVFLLHRQEFMGSYVRGWDTLDRAGWMNPNVVGGTIGCGVVIATGVLFDGLEKKIIYNLFLYFTIGVSLVVLILNASRGALVATSFGSLLFLFLNNKVSLFNKLAIALFIVAILFYLYKNDYFELLAYRIAEEANNGTGGNRFPIWQSKLDAMRSEGDLSQLFGIGQQNTINIGIVHRTHNDFVTAIVSYGYIGFLLFFLLLFYPIFHNFSTKKTIAILPYFSFLVLECMVLEPLFRGYFLFIAFFLYLFKFSEIYDKSKKLNYLHSCNENSYNRATA